MDSFSIFKVKNLNLREFYVYLLILSSFISIALFEILVVFGVLYGIYCLIASLKQRKIEGKLGLPIVVYAFTTVISTALFARKNFVRSLEEGLYQLIYFFRVPSNVKFIRNIIYIFLTSGILIAALVLWNYRYKGYTKGFWGGEFEVGQYYAEISLMLFVVFTGYFADFFKKKDIAKQIKIIFICSGVILFSIFFIILILSTKRSPLLGFFVVFLLIITVMMKNGVFKKKAVLVSFLAICSGLVIGFNYLSMKDVRFRTLKDLILGKKEVSQTTLSVVTSSRSKIFYDALKVIEKEVAEKKYVNLLIGNGIRPGYYLPHWKTNKSCTRYESIFIVSEFIEKGFVGLLAELFIIFYAFKMAYSSRLRELTDFYAFSLYIPLLVHLVGVSFTFFWDALLPMYFLLFRIGEKYFESQKLLKG